MRIDPENNPLFKIELEDEELGEIHELLIKISEWVEEKNSGYAIFLGMVYLTELFDFLASTNGADAETLRLYFAQWFLAHPDSKFSHQIVAIPLEDEQATVPLGSSVH